VREEKEDHEEEEIDEDELELFWESVHEGDLETIEALLVGDEEHPPIGISVNISDKAGMTPLIWLTVEGHAACVQWLVDDVFADVSKADQRYGQTALHFAAVKDRQMISQLLLQRHADPMQRDNAGWTPLHAAARAGAIDVATVLLGKLSTAQINCRGGLGQTPLHRAAFFGHAELVELLLRHGADCNIVDSAGRRPEDVIGDGVDQHADMPVLHRMLHKPCPM